VSDLSPLTCLMICFCWLPNCELSLTSIKVRYHNVSITIVRTRFVAVVQQPTPMAVHTVTVSTGEFGRGGQNKMGAKVRASRIIGDGIATGVRTGQ